MELSRPLKLLFTSAKVYLSQHVTTQPTYPCQSSFYLLGHKTCIGIVCALKLSGLIPECIKVLYGT